MEYLIFNTVHSGSQLGNFHVSVSVILISRVVGFLNGEITAKRLGREPCIHLSVEVHLLII